MSWTTPTRGTSRKHSPLTAAAHRLPIGSLHGPCLAVPKEGSSKGGIFQGEAPEIAAHIERPAQLLELLVGGIIPDP